MYKGNTSKLVVCKGNTSNIVAYKGNTSKLVVCKGNTSNIVAYKGNTSNLVAFKDSALQGSITHNVCHYVSLRHPQINLD